MSEWETIGKPKADDSGWETISAPKAAAKPPKAEPKPRATPEATPPEDPLGQGLGIPILETAASMGSGMVAKPIGDIAGLAATGWDALTGQGERAPIKGSTRPIGPEQFREDVIKGLTYEPRSAGGKMLTENNPLAWLSKLWGKGAEMAGDVVTGDPTKAGPLRTGRSARGTRRQGDEGRARGGRAEAGRARYHQGRAGDEGRRAPTRPAVGLHHTPRERGEGRGGRPRRESQGRENPLGEERRERDAQAGAGGRCSRRPRAR